MVAASLVSASVAAPAGRGYSLYHVLCLALMPLGLLAINPSVFINPGGNDFLDPWVYTGFLLDFPALLRRFGDTYYATRLPWLLPGFALNTVLPPLAAHYVLHLSFFYLLVLSTYWLVASAGNASAAFIASLFVAWNPLLLTALSWDYVDGAGIAFLLLAICGLERSAGAATASRWWCWSLLAGAGMACMVATNLALLTAIPACVLYLLVRAESPRWRSTPAVLGAAALGATVALMTLGALNAALRGSWFFLEPSVHFGMRLRSITNIWKTPTFDWRGAEWVELPIYAAVGAVVSLVVRRRAASRLERAPQAALLALTATWLLFDIAGGTAFFRYSYYTSYLVALALIALPFQGPPMTAGRTRRSIVACELAVLAILAAPHLLAWINPPHRYGFVGWEPVILGIAILGLQIIRPPALRLAIFVVGLMLSYAASNQYWKVQGPRGRADFVATAGAHQFIAKNVGARPIRIWHPALTAASPPFRSIACTYLCDRMLVNDDLPRLTREQALAIAPQTRLVLLVNTDSEADAARASLRDDGLDYTVVARQQFSPSERPFLVIVADVVPLPPEV